jgi:hypothetical protein
MPFNDTTAVFVYLGKLDGDPDKLRPPPGRLNARWARGVYGQEKQIV